MANTLISLVIPVYNGVGYLPELLESIAGQTRLPDEIIFVDDGSTDASASLLLEFSDRIPNVKIFRQENRGQAVARNVGVEHATGRYIAFLDADDIVLPNMYMTLVTMAETDNLDIAMINGWNFHEGRKDDTLIFNGIDDTGVTTGEKWFQSRWLAKYMPHYCWLNLYRRQFIESLNLRFPDAAPHEDVMWVTRSLLSAQRFRFNPSPQIMYRKKRIWPTPPALANGKTAFVRNRVIESGFYNTRALADISRNDSFKPLTRELIRKDFVNGGCNLIRSIRNLKEPAQRSHYLCRVQDEKFVSFLWAGARGSKEHLRVLRYGVLSVF